MLISRVLISKSNHMHSVNEKWLLINRIIIQDLHQTTYLLATREQQDGCS